MEICSGQYNALNWVRGQGHSDRKLVCDTPPSQDAFTHTKFGVPVSKNIGDMHQAQRNF